MEKKLFLLGIPHHNNLGDSAIAYAEQKFLKDKLPQYECICIPQENLENEADKLKDIIKKDDIIFMHGGGNMGCEYIIVEEQRRKIVQTFPNNKIIFFPQTIYYKDNEYEQNELKKSKEIYSKHQNLTIVAREEKSFEIIKKNFAKNRVILTPDIVMYLNEQKEEQDRYGALMIMRKDRERNINDIQMQDMKAVLLEKYSKVEIDDTVRGDKKMADLDRKDRLEELWNMYRNAEIVVTDRLHGMIFAAITGTPCIALNNYNHKIAETAKWLKDLKYIQHMNDINDFRKMLKTLDDVKEIKYNNEFATKRYELIIENIN